MEESGDTVEIFDTTLRDGEQTPGVSLTAEEKIQIAKHLQTLQVDIIEAGFPVTSEGEFRSVQKIAREVREPTIAALARTKQKDIEMAWKAIREARKPRIHLFISTSDIHLTHMLQMSRQQVLDAAVESVQYARELTDDVQFSAQDATRTEVGFLVEILTAAREAGAVTLNIPDTVGYSVPSEHRLLFEQLSDQIPLPQGTVLSAHTHDDLGGALANAMAAVKGGARQVECTINGIGERAGNCPLEEVVMALKTRRDFYRLSTSVDEKHLYRSSRLVASLTGIPTQPNKAIVGKNAFSHEAGIHQDGMLKNRTTYEIMRPEDVGFQQSELVLGKHSGRHAFESRLAEMGYELEAEKIAEAFDRFKELADQKVSIADRDIAAIVDNQLARTQQIVKLNYFLISTGNVAIPNATVRLEIDGQQRERSACGDGPVDAVFRAVNQAVGSNPRLVDYRLESVTRGTDALGDVTVWVEGESGDTVHIGRGLSPDVLRASVLAYVDAMNKILASCSASADVRSSAGDAEEPADEQTADHRTERSRPDESQRPVNDRH